MTMPVAPARIAAAKARGIANVEAAAVACRLEGMPFPAAMALIARESHGRNVWHNDRVTDDHGKVIEWGTFSGLKDEPVEATYRAFIYEVTVLCRLSNGIGPCGVTYAGSIKTRADGTRYRDGGYFRIMEAAGLKPWVPVDNMRFGFRTMMGHYKATGSWVTSGRLYNGSLSYGQEYAVEVEEWRTYLRTATK